MTATGTASNARTLDEALVGLHFAMVGTADDGVWKSRPLTLTAVRGSTLHFLVSADADWVQGMKPTGSPAGVTFSDPHQNTYVALQGHATVSADRDLISEVWNVEAGAYFEGEDDPAIRVLSVSVEYGEYWDSPSGTLGRLLAMAKAASGIEAGTEGSIRV